MALTLHDSTTTPKAPPRTVRFDELPATAAKATADLKTAPPRPPGAVEVTFDNWEEVYWQELKSALYDPVLDFPDASEAVRKRICALKDEVFAKHNIT